jgi:hypothetical protein
MESIGMRDQMKACAVRDNWTIVFERGIDVRIEKHNVVFFMFLTPLVTLQKDIDTKPFNLTMQHIPEEHVRQAVELSLDPKSVKSLRDEHDKFRQVFLLVSNALTLFFDKK